MERGQVGRRHRHRGALEERPGLCRLGERDHVTQRRRPGQQHRDPVVPEGEPAVRRRPGREGIEQEAEAPPLFVSRDAELALRDPVFQARYAEAAAILSELEQTFVWRPVQKEGWHTKELVRR